MSKTEKSSDYLRAVKDRIDSEITGLDRDPDDWVKNRISAIDKVLPKLPDRDPTRPGNITMKQHMKNVRKRLVDSPAMEIDQKRQELHGRKQFVEAEIDRLDSQSDDRG